MNKKIAIIIPTYNRKNLTEKCVKTLLNSTNKDIKIFICDSNSIDGTEKIFLNNKDIIFLNVGSDSWWTASVNFGIQNAINYNFDYILIMNDDIDFDEDLIEKLLEKSLLFPNSIISPSQQSKFGNFLGMEYNGLFKLPKAIYSKENLNTNMIVATTNGCCLMIPISVFLNKIYFDFEMCPHLSGDTEFQIRANYAGYPTISFSDIQIRQGATTNYFSKVKINNFLTFKGSPVLFTSYWKFGQSLFQGNVRFLLFGIIYHYRYFKSICRGVFEILSNKNHKNLIK